MDVGSGGRRVVLGVCGGIAAYKAVEVCRRLVDAGAHVVPVMTAGATRFVGEVTFSALASEPVRRSLFGRARSHPAHPTGPGRRPDRRRARHRPAAVGLRGGVLPRPADQRAARHPGAGDGVPRDAHRDVGAPGGAGQPRRCCVRAACTSCSPEEGRLAGGDVGAGRLAEPGDDRRRRCRGARRRLGERTTWPGSGCSSPPAAPASRSIRCASSATARRASRATPSPRRPRHRGAEVTLVTTTHAAGRPRHRARAGRDRRRDARRGDGACARPPTSWSWPRRSPTSRPVRVAEREAEEARRRARGRAGADRRHPRRRSAHAKPPEPDAGRLRGRDQRRRGATPRRSCAAKGADLLVANDVVRGGRRVRTRHQRGADPVRRTADRDHVPLTDKRSVARAVLDAVVESAPMRI